MVLFDTFARGIYEGKLLRDLEFELLEWDGEGKTKKVKYKGCWLLVDNGYRGWSTTVPPIKSTCSRKEIRWSEWIELMRKDVECTFGILKGRWGILKTGVQIQGTVAGCDTIWKWSLTHI